MTLAKDIKENQVLLVLVPGSKYSLMSMNVAKNLSKKKVLFVTLNKTVGALKESFTKKKVDFSNFFFIDAITSSITSTAPKAPDCKFISSPSALSELSLGITKQLTKDYDYLIFDSLTNLLIYQGKSPVAKFVSLIVNKIRAKKTKALFYALEMNQHQELIQEAEMFMDKVTNYK